MALQDFLGKTMEIRIIDFLAQNRAFTYNQTEISECLGVSRTSVNLKLPDLIFNGIVEVKEKQGNANYYQLANNGIVKKLISSVFENGLLVSGYDTGEEIVLSEMRQIVGPESGNEICECFCYPETTDEFDIPMYLPRFDAHNTIVEYEEHEGPVSQVKRWDDIKYMDISTAVSA